MMMDALRQGSIELHHRSVSSLSLSSVKPEYPSLTISEETIEENQPVTLTCSSFNGNPAPEYTWSRNGTLLTYVNCLVRFSTAFLTLSTSSSLQFTESTSICHGQQFQPDISCQSTWQSSEIWMPYRQSSIGRTTSTGKGFARQMWVTNSRPMISVYLHRLVSLIDRPYVTIVEQPPMLFAKDDRFITIEESELKLTCQIDANPEASSIYWTMNGTTILSRTCDEHRERNDDRKCSSSLFLGDRTLHLPRLAAEQSGLYTCVVENSIGKANHSVQVDVQCKSFRWASRVKNKRLDCLFRCTSSSSDGHSSGCQSVWFCSAALFRRRQSRALSDHLVQEWLRNLSSESLIRSSDRSCRKKWFRFIHLYGLQSLAEQLDEKWFQYDRAGCSKSADTGNDLFEDRSRDWTSRDLDLSRLWSTETQDNLETQWTDHGLRWTHRW